MSIDTTKTYVATVITTAGTFTINLDAAKAPEDGEQLRLPGPAGLLPLRDLPPGHPELHGPDRRPDRDRHGRSRLHHPRRAAGRQPARSTRSASVAMANTGQPNTGGSQFFIVTGTEGESLPATYTLFGQVPSGAMTVPNLINHQGCSRQWRPARGDPAHLVDHHLTS